MSKSLNLNHRVSEYSNMYRLIVWRGKLCEKTFYIWQEENTPKKLINACKQARGTPTHADQSQVTQCSVISILQGKYNRNHYQDYLLNDHGHIWPQY